MNASEGNLKTEKVDTPGRAYVTTNVVEGHLLRRMVEMGEGNGKAYVREVKMG